MLLGETKNRREEQVQKKNRSG